jgi:hypothetical protein
VNCRDKRFMLISQTLPKLGDKQLQSLVYTTRAWLG